MAVDDPCIITCAVSGAVADKRQCPGIPYTPDEYAKEVRRARDAGASMVHIHAREPNGTPTVAVEHYRAITQAVLAETPDIVINYSTGWVGLPMAERVGHISELRPEIGVRRRLDRRLELGLRTNRLRPQLDAPQIEREVVDPIAVVETVRGAGGLINAVVLVGGFAFELAEGADGSHAPHVGIGDIGVASRARCAG